MVSYPGSFLRLLQANCDLPSLLTKIKDLDKDATEKKAEYVKLEDELLTKANQLILNKEASAEDVKAFLQLDLFAALEARREENSTTRSQTVKEALSGYDLLDTQIEKLDNDIVALEPHMKTGLIALPGAKRKYKKGGSDAGQGLAKKSAIKEEATTTVQEDLPVDPNEPVYCVCKKVSFGQMIGCDNDDCPLEWFHFECVGLTEKPQGSWLCPVCAPPPPAPPAAADTAPTEQQEEAPASSKEQEEVSVAPTV